MREIYQLVHEWNYANGHRGHYEMSYSDIDIAFDAFKYLKLLIENDTYDFDVKFTDYCEGDMYFSAYEKEDSIMNRDILVLKQIEVLDN